jgi:hypothetical protein
MEENVSPHGEVIVPSPIRVVVNWAEADASHNMIPAHARTAMVLRRKMPLIFVFLSFGS